MITTKIYRYERETFMGDFLGAYSANDTFEDFTKKREAYVRLKAVMLSKHSNAETHPCIWDDVNGFKRATHFCACPTLDSLKEWFKGFNTNLIKLGFNLVEIEVKKVYYSKSGKQLSYELKDIISKKILK